MWDFSQEVTDINQVPEQFRFVYQSSEEEGNDAIVINPQYTALTEAIVGLNGALGDSRQEAREAQSNLKAWNALGEDPTKISESIAQLTADRDDALAKNKSFDPKKMQADLQKEWEGKVTEAVDAGNQLKGELKSALINSAAMGAINKHKGESALLMPIIGSQVQMVQDAKSGRHVVQVIDNEGLVRYSATSGGLMTVDELVAEMKGSATYGMAFKGNLKAGGGQGGDGQSRIVHGKNVGDMSATEKISAGLGD